VKWIAVRFCAMDLVLEEGFQVAFALNDLNDFPQLG
jgi:hypothetical protein